MFEQWPFAKSFPIGRMGMVGTKHPLAARVGTEILREGGNAVDAAVGVSLALGVVEPYLSGIGGGGLVVFQLAGGSARAFHCGMQAPSSARPDMYEVLPDTHDIELFGWPRTRHNANVLGPRSVGVPGLVSGLRALWEEAGTIPWQRLVSPAAALATHGFRVDWQLSLRTLQGFDLLSRFPVSRATFMPEGRPPIPEVTRTAEVLRLPALGQTYRAIASDSAALARGAAAEAIVQATDGYMTIEDLSSYSPQSGVCLDITFAGHTVQAVPWATGGPTLLEWLGLLGELDPPRDESDPELWWAIIRSGDVAFRDRLTRLADPTFVPFPDEILDTGYHRRTAHAIRAGEVESPLLPPSAGSTSHTSVVDAQGNCVSITQTLLSMWGSGITTSAGVILNNGMMWFDPEPGRLNSVQAGKRPLANMCPVLVQRDGAPFLILGASGGRRIIPAEVQILVRVLLLGQSLSEAIAAPRFELSTHDIVADSRFAPELVDALAARLNRPIRIRGPVLGASPWASPVGLQRLEDGSWTGGADPFTLACVVSA